MAARLNTPTPPPPCRPRVSRFSETLSESGFGLCGEEVSVSKRDGSRFGMAAAEGFDSTPLASLSPARLVAFPPTPALVQPSRSSLFCQPINLCLLRDLQHIPPPSLHLDSTFPELKSCFVAKISGPQKTGRIAAELLGKNCEWKFPTRVRVFGSPLEHSLNERTRLERRTDGRGFDF